MTEAATFASSFPEKCSQSDVSVERINAAPEKWLLVRRHHLGLGFPAKFQQIPTDSDSLAAESVQRLGGPCHKPFPVRWDALSVEGFVASAARCCNALTALTSESPFLLRRVSCPRQESKQQKRNLHVTHVLKTASTLTSFDIRISRNNCCLSSAIMGWSAPLPAFQTQTFWYTWYALPLCRV